jgi:hypothetical protein
MKITEMLASGLNRRDDEPNKALADEIIRSERSDLVRELIDNLNNKDKNIQSDCIKVLYEIGERGPAKLIAPYYKEFGDLLKSKNNRMVWGAMIALDNISQVNPAGVFSMLPLIVQTIDKGSVITIDHGVGILANLSALKEYAGQTLPLLMEQLKRCPIKQLPMYAEKAERASTPENKGQFIELLELRLSETERDTQKSRLHKVIKRMRNK